MSHQELYEIARQRIDRRNRRWTLWAANLALLLISIGGVVILSKTALEGIAIAVMLSVIGIFVFHTIMAAMAESRDGDIEKEIGKLREFDTYEKPKRLELGDDGELVEISDDDAQLKRKS